MSGRGARGRPTQSRLLYVCIGFVLGAIFSTVIQNISDNHLELYHQSAAQLEGTSSESEDIIAARCVIRSLHATDLTVSKIYINQNSNLLYEIIPLFTVHAVFQIDAAS